MKTSTGGQSGASGIRVSATSYSSVTVLCHPDMRNA